MTSPEPGAAAPGPILVTFGSNIAPAVHLPRALALLRQRVDVRSISRVYRSPAVDSPGAPEFWNATAWVATTLPPARLKHEVLRPIEAALGRVRTAIKSAPRTIDLDLDLYGSLVMADPAGGLELPDPDLLRRAYAAVPAADLAPEFCHPQTGETLAEIATRLRRGSEISQLPDVDGWRLAG